MGADGLHASPTKLILLEGRDDAFAVARLRGQLLVAVAAGGASWVAVGQSGVVGKVVGCSQWSSRGLDGHRPAAASRAPVQPGVGHLAGRGGGTPVESRRAAASFSLISTDGQIILRTNKRLDFPGA